MMQLQLLTSLVLTIYYVDHGAAMYGACFGFCLPLTRGECKESYFKDTCGCFQCYKVTGEECDNVDRRCNNKYSECQAGVAMTGLGTGTCVKADEAEDGDGVTRPRPGDHIDEIVRMVHQIKSDIENNSWRPNGGDQTADRSSVRPKGGDQFQKRGLLRSKGGEKMKDIRSIRPKGGDQMKDTGSLRPKGGDQINDISPLFISTRRHIIGDQMEDTASLRRQGGDQMKNRGSLRPKGGDQMNDIMSLRPKAVDQMNDMDSLRPKGGDQMKDMGSLQQPKGGDQMKDKRWLRPKGGDQLKIQRRSEASKLSSHPWWRKFDVYN